MKTVGVVIATYNGEKFINEQLQSIVSQTKSPEKIIIVDDCSTDGTKKIINEKIKIFPELFVFIENEQNLGVTKTFEIGISACKNDYIALCDQDDIWMPNKISELFALLEKNEDAKLCFHDLALIDEQGNRLGRNFWEAAPIPLPVTGTAARKRLANIEGIVPGCTMFFSSDLKKIILPMPESRWILHDWWISAITFFFANPVPFRGEPLAFYRLHANQTGGIPTTIKKKKNRKNRINLYDKIKREIKRIINSKKSHIIKTVETNQRRYYMSNVILGIIDERKKHGLSEEQMEEYNFLRKRIKYNMMTDRI